MTSRQNDFTADDFNDFYKSFVATMLWSEAGNEDGQIDDESSPEEMHPNLREVLREQCEAFCRANVSDLIEATQRIGYTIEQAGHDFALSRNGHGAGFFDRGLGDVGDRLQEAAQKAGQLDLYFGDDGIIYAGGLETATPQGSSRRPGI